MSLILTNPKIVINSVDLSSHIDSVHLESTATDLDTTTFGNTAKRHASGLLDNKVTLEFQQDEALASVEATIYPLIGSTTTMTVWPNGGTTSTTNPAYTMTVVVEQWIPLDGKAGDLSKASITWPVDGTITKSNS